MGRHWLSNIRQTIMKVTEHCRQKMRTHRKIKSQTNVIIPLIRYLFLSLLEFTLLLSNTVYRITLLRPLLKISTVIEVVK